MKEVEKKEEKKKKVGSDCFFIPFFLLLFGAPKAGLCFSSICSGASRACVKRKDDEDEAEET